MNSLRQSTSWIALLLCLVISLFANFFYSFYMTFSRQAEYANRLAEKLEVEANELPYVGHLPVLTPAASTNNRGATRNGEGTPEGF
jgi:flagellar basal body-associated protein FliL